MDTLYVPSSTTLNTLRSTKSADGLTVATVLLEAIIDVPGFISLIIPVLIVPIAVASCANVGSDGTTTLGSVPVMAFLIAFLPLLADVKAASALS
ncbi:hypothetical protein M3197_12145 [Sporosarcina aquimarina]|uniref:hypothetical protein n=1 Tax=Sporosarcina aquimarina TaxID=114975 RepID=UPI00204041C0|nr:hypothetical protein [Sporosarcina aquimarina]MCM3758214.1 hypothetical protein [Sporosarcina aquimarina]